jgi:hypothetical protein
MGIYLTTKSTENTERKRPGTQLTTEITKSTERKAGEKK